MADEKEKETQKILKQKGKVFYTTMPLVETSQKVLVLPRIKIKGSFIEYIQSIIWFVFGTAESLLIMRAIMIELGIKGENLLSYLLYATSYPFAILLNSHEEQIPIKSANGLFETIAIMAIYMMAGLVLYKAASLLSSESTVEE